jgi:iron complex transport system substrate-binding protein
LRIASLLASGTEIVHLLGQTQQLVAISHECDYPRSILDRPRVTSARITNELSSQQIDTQVREASVAAESLYTIDVETLAAQRPDVIITQAQCDVCAVRYEDVVEAVASQRRLQGTRVVALNPTTLDEILADVINVGRAIGCEAEAAHEVARLEERINTVRRQTEVIPLEDRPSVMCVEWIEPLMAAANWMPALVELAGGENVLTTPASHSSYTAWDDVLAADPQVVVFAPCGFDLRRTLQEWSLLAEKPGWNRISAVEHDRVYAADGNAYFNRSGPRIVESLEILAHLIHPRYCTPPLEPHQRNAVWRKLNPRVA